MTISGARPLFLADSDDENSSMDDAVEDEGPMNLEPGPRQAGGPGVRAFSLGHTLLQRIARGGSAEGEGRPGGGLLSILLGGGEERGADLLTAILGEDIFRHYEDLQMEMAMQLSLRENPDYQDIDMSYESLVNLEDVKRTAEEGALAGLKRSTFCSRRLRSQCTEPLSEDVKCSVCQMEYEESDELLELPCNHRFHAGCIDKWLREYSKACPTCRADVPGEAEKGEGGERSP